MIIILNYIKHEIKVLKFMLTCSTLQFQTLRRLAQNREAARKSRLRKKVCFFYVNQAICRLYPGLCLVV